MSRESTSAGFAYAAAIPVAVSLALVSLGGLLLPDAYAREQPAWTAQAVGQDWFDLVVAAPWIAWCGLRARSGSGRWRILLAGGYAYAVYEMLIYAFAVHFNALFLLYCATLGLAGYALAAIAIDLSAHTITVERRRARQAGAFLVLVGVAFGAMWLAEDLPAALRGEPAASLAETGLLTNPVHVIDYAFVLPAHVIAGVLLWRQRRAGALFGAVVLAFGVLMAASIGGMMLVIRLSGDPAPVAVIAAMFAVAAATATLLVRLRVPSDMLRA
ncbi:MAG: hypothetical protein F9K40_07820 [Kofleriaceae bacterium]|nr:MAG: hypothetical protein F9K40_07820 [Kofleriaceae bacterium]MBZ0237135.1 hypothetical protein [Kofleriaceae bacterium]